MEIETLIQNATRTGKESQHVALACGFLPGLEGVKSLCVWCAERYHGTDVRVFRLPRGGQCQECAYAGHDCLVVRS